MKSVIDNFLASIGQAEDERINQVSSEPEEPREDVRVRLLRKIFGDRVSIAHKTPGGFERFRVYDCGNAEERYISLFEFDGGSKACSIQLPPRPVPLIRSHQARQDAVNRGEGPYERDPEVIAEHRKKYGI